MKPLIFSIALLIAATVAGCGEPEPEPQWKYRVRVGNQWGGQSCECDSYERVEDTVFCYDAEGELLAEIEIPHWHAMRVSRPIE